MSRMEPLSLSIDYGKRGGKERGTASPHAVCQILIQEGIVERIAECVERILSLSDELEASSSSLAIITDSNVAKIHGGRVADVLSSISQGKLSVIKFPAGEKNKTLSTASELARDLDKNGADRKTLLFALGGGVVGDLAGFVASIYKRGIRYFQIPTTLLAQVDSSIGGKTGVDTEWGKNQLGTFYEPLGVLIDPSLLDSLPKSEFINGLAEIVKTAVIYDRGMFERLRRLKDTDLRALASLKPFIGETCKIKAKIVSTDEREDNLRAILNFGHTVGHSLEASSKFRLSHGYSVILGMLAEGWIATRMSILSREDFEVVESFLLRILTSYADIPALGERRGASAEESEFPRALIMRTLRNEEVLERFALADKKSTAWSNTIRMSLPEKVGRMMKGSEQEKKNGEESSYKIPTTSQMFVDSIRYLRSALYNFQAK